MKRLTCLGIATLAVNVLSGCLAGPRYQRPSVVTPPEYRDAIQALPSAASPEAALGDLKWSDVFKDEQLKALVAEALKNNFDLRIAAQRILQQQAEVGITRAKGLPVASAGASYDAIGLPSGLPNNTPTNFHGGGFTAAAAWNLDFWGLYRRQNEAARAELLATEWGRRATLTSVVMVVATSYIQLRALDAQLEITRNTINARKESLRLINKREQVGVATMSDVHEAEQLLYTAEVNAPNLELQIRQQENNLSIVLGRDPGPISRAGMMMEQPVPADVAQGIPSQLLARRPDIQKAEAELIASNARIGVARAQFFPQVSITGLGGTSSSQLNKLFDSNSSFWFGLINVSQPIFEGGKLKNSLRESEAKNAEMVATYEQTVASAFRDVSNALIARQKSEENRIAQVNETVAAEKSVQLAQLRYDNGGSSYLELLTNSTNFYSAQLNLVGARQQEALSLVQLYASLGGGWNQN